MEERPSWEVNSHSVKKLHTSYQTKRSITVCTTSRHRSLSWARWIHFTTSLIISLRSILILSPHLRGGLPSGLLPLGFQTKILYAFLVSSMHVTCFAYYRLWFDHPNNIWWSVQVMKLLIMQFSSSLLSLPPSQVQIFSSAPCSQTPSVYVLPVVWDTKLHSHTKQLRQ